MTAYKIKKILRKNNLTFINVEKVLNSFGYSVVFFNTPDGDEEIQRYELEEEAETLKSFVYAETAHIVFINDELPADDKLYLSLHELGHIILGHVGDGKLNTRNSILIDIEADNFAYSIIYPSKKTDLYNLIASFVLSASIIFGACYVCNQSKSESVPVIGIQDYVPPEATQSHSPQSDAVYVTSSGKKFHRADCRYVKNKTNVTELERDTAESMYEPCSVCNP